MQQNSYKNNTNHNTNTEQKIKIYSDEIHFSIYQHTNASNKKQNISNKLPQGTRLDTTLSNMFPHLSRSKIQELIKNENILINSKTVTSSYKTKHKDTVYINFISTQKFTNIIPKKIAFEIVFQDEHLMVINKPANLTVHPGAGNWSDTLVNGLQYYFLEHNAQNLYDNNKTNHTNRNTNINKNQNTNTNEKINTNQTTHLSDIDKMRPGIVHRIDKNTSGIIVIAKTNTAHMQLANQFKLHTIKRKYICFCYGIPIAKNNTIENYIARDNKNRLKMSVMKNNSRGKNAITLYEVLKTYQNKLNPNQTYSKIICELKTGRTHQIRVHMSHINHPLIGDDVYGTAQCINQNTKLFNLHRQALHAFFLEFTHPITQETMQFSSDLDKDLLELEVQLESM